jgi:hypothetical protein
MILANPKVSVHSRVLIITTYVSKTFRRLTLLEKQSSNLFIWNITHTILHANNITLLLRDYYLQRIINYSDILFYMKTFKNLQLKISSKPCTLHSSLQ